MKNTEAYMTTPLQKAVEEIEKRIALSEASGVFSAPTWLIKELLSAAKQLEALQAATGLCDKHKPNGGSRNCLVCGCEQMSFSLSRISYICGQPNEMKMSEYDTHYNCEEVVKQVEALQKENEELKEKFNDMIHLRDLSVNKCDSFKSALKSCEEALSIKPLTQLNWLQYINYEFPSTKGHIPLIELFAKQTKALSLVKQVLEQKE